MSNRGKHLFLSLLLKRGNKHEHKGPYFPKYKGFKEKQKLHGSGIIQTSLKNMENSISPSSRKRQWQLSSFSETQGKKPTNCRFETNIFIQHFLSISFFFFFKGFPSGTKILSWDNIIVGTAGGSPWAIQTEALMEKKRVVALTTDRPLSYSNELTWQYFPLLLFLNKRRCFIACWLLQNGSQCICNAIFAQL